jgi:hypothetical protein
MLIPFWFMLPQVNIWKADKKVALWRKRLYLPTPIPVLSENDVVDLPVINIHKIYRTLLN